MHRHHRTTHLPRSSARLRLFSAVALACVSACEPPLEIADETSVVGTQQALLFHDDDVVRAWNEHVLATATAHDGLADPFIATRAMTMVHVAMHDAVNATAYRFYRPYAYDGRDYFANPVAAAASAAHRVLVHVYPAQEAALAGLLAQSLADVKDGTSEQRGVALGAKVADRIVALRANDGFDVDVPYMPRGVPGAYQYTTEGVIYRPGFRNVKPWALDRADQFRPPPPPALESETYTKDFEEVRSKGRKDSTTRTADETAYANFWYELSELGWNRVTRVVAEQEGLGLATSARLFALVNMALFDGYVAGWEAKFHYDTWRPITAIHRADTDGNPATAADPSFEPLLPTPPVQDYPSTHSVLGAAAAEVLTRSLPFGSRIGFTMSSPTALDPNVDRRTLVSFRAAARENAESRIVAGIHFRHACDAGLALGVDIGKHVAERLLGRHY